MEDLSESEQPNVGKIISDFNKLAAKKAQKKENTLISYAMQATARDQVKNIMISKLKGEIGQYLDKVALLEMENEVKEELLHEKDNELEDLKTENRKLKALLLQQKHQESPKVTSFIPLTPAINKIHNDALSYNNNNYQVISTFSNIIASPKNEMVTTNHNSVVSTTSDSPAAQVAKPKCTKLKRSFERTKDPSQLSSIGYKLRKRVAKSK